ncbi:MAG: hypothetical protein R3D56_00485 [Paracoccaceae bacterium]|jgi:hypothetical protein
MFVGFFLRRIVTVLLCATAFWAGVKADNLFAGAPAPAADCAGG